MAYVDLIAASSYGSYNKQLCRMLGLTTAVYVSELSNISREVLYNKTYDSAGFFTIDRESISYETSLVLEDQLKFDSILENLGIIEKDVLDENKLRIDFRALEKLIIDGQSVTIDKADLKLSKEQKATNKSALIVASLKKCVKSFESDAELISAYESWVETVYDKGMCKKAQIKLFIDTINNFTSDHSKKLDVINTAISCAYKNADWAINKVSGHRKIEAPTQAIANASDLMEAKVF